MKSNEQFDELPDELKPCDHMVSLVSRRADETLSGPAKWLTDVHLLTCPHCRAAIVGLRTLHKEVQALAAIPANDDLVLSEEEWEAVAKRLAEERPPTL